MCSEVKSLGLHQRSENVIREWMKIDYENLSVESLKPSLTVETVSKFFADVL